MRQEVLDEVRAKAGVAATGAMGRAKDDASAAHRAAKADRQAKVRLERTGEASAAVVVAATTARPVRVTAQVDEVQAHIEQGR